MWEIEQRFNGGSASDDDRRWLRERGYNEEEINNHVWREENWWNNYHYSEVRIKILIKST